MEIIRSGSCLKRRAAVAFYFDAQTWHALNLLSRESMKTFQELADEAFRDLLQKHGRPTDLRRRCGEREGKAASESGPIIRRWRPSGWL
jgi:hypothetical protein